MILSELFHTTEKNVYKFLSGDYKTEIKRGLREENYKPHTHTHTYIYTVSLIQWILSSCCLPHTDLDMRRQHDQYKDQILKELKQ